jgi:hypothetical protein
MALAVLALVRYRGALATFFFLDDFWVMHDAVQVRTDGLAAVFRPGHAGFGLYRPLTTVAYSYVLQTLVGYDASAQHAVQLLAYGFLVVVAFGVAYRLTGSIAAAMAAVLMQSTAPGQR